MTIVTPVGVGRPTITAMLCPALLGRDAERDRLVGRLVTAERAGGGVTMIIGPAGVGKSRLVTDTAEVAAVTVLAGRAVPTENPTPYRPLAEALLSAARHRDLPDDGSLRGFDGHLARLVPSWGTPTTVDAAPILVGEAIARLLDVWSVAEPCVLVVEDLHWADPETIEVVEYLFDALHDRRGACAVTTRPANSVRPTLDRLLARDPSSVLHISPLDEHDLDEMVRSCLQAEPPPGLAEFVGSYSDGIPFLVEELLAGLVAAGTLRRDGAYWEVVGPLTPALPASLRESITRRMDTLDPVTRRVLGAASLLGRVFDWELLPGIADVDGRTAADALRSCVDAQLVEADTGTFRFRHALTREAILDDLLPPDRRELASRAWPAIERAAPGLPGPTCQLAADLAEAAGDRLAAAYRLVECARRALIAGAFVSAESTARRAQELARDHTDSDVAHDAHEVLVHVLAAAGKSDEAVRAGRDLVDRLVACGAPAERRTDVLVTIVRASLAAGDLHSAGDAVDQARATMAGADDPALRARLDAVAAELALDLAQLDRAEELAARSIAGARATDQPAVLCEALLTLGRIQRPNGIDRSGAAFREAAAVAEGAGLARWHLRAQQELAVDWYDVGTEPLITTRELAARYGAHHTVAVMDLTVADVALGDFDRQRCMLAATACVDASRRYRLSTESVAWLWLAGAHALAGDDPSMHAAIDAALERDPDDPRILADIYGRVLTTRAFVRDELDALPELMDTMMDHVRRAPATTSVYPGRVFWVVLHAAGDPDLGHAAIDEFRTSTAPMGLPYFTMIGEVVDAIVLGRRGETDRATSAIEPVYEMLRGSPIAGGAIRCVWLLVAQAAIRDGWGNPARWLREAEAWFTEREFGLLARRCRALLADAGAPVPRRGRGDSTVPTGLRALGVTSREVDVLKLVVAGHTNAEIAARLYLSPKTVERHLSNLFDRTGVRNRRELAALAAPHLDRAEQR